MFCKPAIVVDGHETRGVWGPNSIPLTPGQHQVHVHVPYILPSKTGPAETTVNLAPGQTTALEYKAPVWTFSKGSLGEGEQKYNGVGILLGVMVVPFAILLILILVMAFTL